MLVLATLYAKNSKGECWYHGRMLFKEFHEALQFLTLFPGKGARGGAKLALFLEEVGLTPLEAARLALAAFPGTTLQALKRERLPLTPEERAGMAALWTETGTPLPQLRALAAEGWRLYLVGGYRALRQGGYALPEEPPPAMPKGLPRALLPGLEKGLVVLEGMPFREALPLALRLGEAMAHLRGLPGVHVGLLSGRGVERARALLLQRWERGVERVGRLPYLPGETSSWMEGIGQELLLPWTAGFLEGVLRGVLPAPEAPLRLLLLSRKVPVLALPLGEPSLFEALLAYLRWAKVMGTGAVLMAPILPPRAREALAEAWEGEGGDLPGLLLGGEPKLAPMAEGDLPWGAGRAFLFPEADGATRFYRRLGGKRAGSFRAVSGVTTALLHGRVPLGEKLRREEGGYEALVSTWWTGAEAAVEGMEVLLVDPLPHALLQAALEAKALRVLFSPSPPSFLPRALLSLSRALVASPSPQAFRQALDGVMASEWWERRVAPLRSYLVEPGEGRALPLPGIRLRGGPGRVFLLPEGGGGKEEGAFAPLPVALERVRPLAEEGWLWIVPKGSLHPEWGLRPS